MPSSTHEGLVDLFRTQPELAALLLQSAFSLEVPQHEEVAISESALSEVAPLEYRADLLLLHKQGDAVRLCVILEVQLERDEDKPSAWAWYTTVAHVRHKCPAVVLVVAADEAIARWAGRAVSLGPGSLVQPLVLGPGDIPKITDLKLAAAYPELAVLSVRAHGDGPDGDEICEVAIGVFDKLDEERGRYYYDLSMAAVSAATRARLEKMMQAKKYEYQTEFARKYHAKGIKEGIEEGIDKGIAIAILKVLSARGLAISEEAKAQITSCRDKAQLESWLEIAATAETAEALFS